MVRVVGLPGLAPLRAPKSARREDEGEHPSHAERVKCPDEQESWAGLGDRAEAFAALQQTIGTHPKEILAAQHSALAAIAKAGILPDISAEKLLTIAKIAHEEFDSDLRAAIKKPLPQAKKALKRFPSIGDPGAEKILLFTHSYPVMALDSNGLRVLCRVGFAEEQKNYSATYRLVRDAIHGQLPRDYDLLIRAHQLLRQHGQELCRRSKPRCAECPLSDCCSYSSKA
jgi:endonuclease III